MKIAKELEIISESCGKYRKMINRGKKVDEEGCLYGDLLIIVID